MPNLCYSFERMICFFWFCYLIERTVCTSVEAATNGRAIRGVYVLDHSRQPHPHSSPQAKLGDCKLPWRTTPPAVPPKLQGHRVFLFKSLKSKRTFKNKIHSHIKFSLVVTWSQIKLLNENNLKESKIDDIILHCSFTFLKTRVPVKQNYKQLELLKVTCKITIVCLNYVYVYPPDLFSRH